MVGITSFGAYVPLLRLDKGAFGKRFKGEKPIANFDEDPITMGVAAGLDCVQKTNRDSIDGLYFASASSPFKEKQAAAAVATVMDLRRNIVTADFANSIRSGTNALISAIDAVSSGRVKQTLVVSSDARLGAPGTPFEKNLGDGAGALLVGDTDVIANLEEHYSIANEMLDIWRLDKDRFLNSWEAHFVLTQGYQKIVSEVISEILKKSGLSQGDFTKIVLYSPDARSGAGLAKKLGFDVTAQLQDPLFSVLRNTGSAYSIMQFVAALEESKAGDRILLVSYGDGADAFIFQVTENVEEAKHCGGIRKYIESKVIVNDYKTYLDLRGLLPGSTPFYPTPLGDVSASALYRDKNANLRFYASKCNSCGQIAFPPQRVCASCYTKDQVEEVRLSDKKASLFTFALDCISSTVDSPTVVGVVEFEGGGRASCYVTDRVVEQIKGGMSMEMTFRKLYTRQGINNHSWKAMPARL